MLGIVLTMVGFVLLHNGWFAFTKRPLEGKAPAVVNFLGGSVIFVGALYTLAPGFTGATYWSEAAGYYAPVPVDYFTAVIYLLVALTYLYIGFDCVFDLDVRPFGVFCLTGAIALAVGAIVTWDGFGFFALWNTIMWISWAVLWFVLFVECAFTKKLGKFTPIFCLATAFYTGIVPAMLILTGNWG